MCGRYTLDHSSEITERFNATNSLKGSDRYNVVPGFDMPVVTRNSPNIIEIMKWGLIPFWAKDEKIGYKMINARAETVAEKPSFKNSLKSKRCLIPCSGFYEWKREGKVKQPFYFKVTDEALFAFAGLYDVWTSPDGKEIKSYTIITTEANEILKPIHDRMPVILHKKDESQWLDPNSDVDTLLKLLKPYTGPMTSYEVSKDVNNPANTDKSLINPVQNSD